MNEKENLTQKYIYTAFLQLLEKLTTLQPDNQYP